MINKKSARQASIREEPFCGDAAIQRMIRNGLLRSGFMPLSHDVWAAYMSLREATLVYSNDLKNWLRKTSGFPRVHVLVVRSARSPLVLRSNSPNHLSIATKQSRFILILWIASWLTPSRNDVLYFNFFP